MKYDEFMDHGKEAEDFRARNAFTHEEMTELNYGFDELGIDEDAACDAGFEDGYDFLAPTMDVRAVLKYCLVYEEGKTPDEITDRYLRENFSRLYETYGEKVHEAFLVDAQEQAEEEIEDNPEYDDEDCLYKALPAKNKTEDEPFQGDLSLNDEIKKLNDKFFPDRDAEFVAEKNEDTGAYRVMLNLGKDEKPDKHRVMITSEYKDVNKLVSDVKKNADAGAFNHLAEYIREAYNKTSKNNESKSNDEMTR